jgi:hypothetical protein
MCTLRNFLYTVVYLGSSGLVLAGILQFPSRPSVVTSGVSMEDASKAIDAQYSDMVKNSDALKYLISGVGGILCNVGVQLLFRRGVQRIRPLVVQAQPPVAAPAPQVVIHELHEPSWVEKAYINSKQPPTPYQDPPL